VLPPGEGTGVVDAPAISNRPSWQAALLDTRCLPFVPNEFPLTLHPTGQPEIWMPTPLSKLQAAGNTTVNTLA